MKVLVITDSSMNVNQGGFQQTLYNIFLFLNPKDLFLVTSLQAYSISPPSAPFDKQVLTYNLEIIPIQYNRLGRFLNGFINRINRSAHQYFNRFKKLQSSIKSLDADVVVVAPNGADGVFIYQQLKGAFSNKKVFPYFMDDWLYQTKSKPAGVSIHAAAKELLSDHLSWLMISKNLADILAERYSIKPERVLSIHNPVNIDGIEPPIPVVQKSRYTIAYAGALWPMHFDAFLVMAKAIEILNKEIKIRLIVYTSQSNWDWRKEKLESLDVEFGGHIPYAQIHSTLAKADCLLITSSFTKEWQTHSKGSVQTKITDYLKAGRLIISCGPTYSANHDFLKKYNCGVCIETNNTDEVATALKNIFEHIELNQTFVQHGYKILTTEFSFEVVQDRLKQFLAA